jgi:hypothetical protein
LDPNSDFVDLLFGESFTFGRHLVVGILAGDHLNQSAFFSVLDIEDRTAAGTFEYGRSQVEPQISSLLARPVALGAMLIEDRGNVSLKIDSGL